MSTTAKKLKKYLSDISDCCKCIREYTTGKKYEDYINDRMLRSAVEREFITIGEALKQAVAIQDGLIKQITKYEKIMSFRNRIIHGYALIDDEIVWGIIKKYLPQLEEEVNKLLDKKD